MKEQVLEWMSSYNAPIAQRRWEKQLEDLEKLVTPKDIQAFDKSDLVRNAISTLGHAWGCEEKTSSPHKLNIGLSETTYLQPSA